MIRRPIIVKENLSIDSEGSTLAPTNPAGWLSEVFEESDNCRSTVRCDGCMKPIETLRFKCCLCEDFDLCGDCIQFAELKHNMEHSFWMKVVPLSPYARLPNSTDFYWKNPILTQLGPILVSSKLLHKMGVKNVEVRTHTSNYHPYRFNPETQHLGPLQPGDIEIHMDIPLSLLSGMPQQSQVDQSTSQTTSTQTSFEPTPVQSSPTPVQSLAPVESSTAAQPTTPVQTQPQEIKSDVQNPLGMEIETSQADNEVSGDLLKKLKELEEMGFTDLATNLSLLRIFDGKIETTINHLLREY